MQLAPQQPLKSTIAHQLQQLASDAEPAATTGQRAGFVSATEQFADFNSMAGSCSASQRFMQLASQQQLTRFSSQQLRQSNVSQHPAQVGTASQRIACQGARMAAQVLTNGSTCSSCKPQGGEIVGTHDCSQLSHNEPSMAHQLAHISAASAQQLAYIAAATAKRLAHIAAAQQLQHLTLQQLRQLAT
jgi:hypothetical protein